MSTHTAEEIAAGHQRREDIRTQDAERCHRIRVVGLSTMPYDIDVTLDGKRIKGLCSLSFNLNQERLMTVTMEIEALVDVDVELTEESLSPRRHRYNARPPQDDPDDDEHG